MFEDYYGLKTKPFSKTPDPKFLFLSRSHEEALARLQYAVEEKDMAVLTGEVGCGKTTLTRALMDLLGPQYNVVNIINPRLSPSQFLRTVAMRMEIDIPTSHKADLLDDIYKKVYKDYERGVSHVIIIDEAHLIPTRDTFEEIRLLTNFQLDYVNLISLILVGQPDLRRRLNHKTYLPFRQRIGLFAHLGPIGLDEIKEYVEFRLKTSGRDDVLFTEGALASLHRNSGGIPRVINSVATTALLDGFAREVTIIDEPLIEEASKEMGLHGHFEN